MTERVRRVFAYELPTRIVFGEGVASKVGDRIQELGASRALVVTDPGVQEAGIVDAVTDPLKQASIPYELFSDVTPEPEASSVTAGVEAAKGHGADTVIALGGGSALDVGKAVGVMMCNHGDICDYEGQHRIPHPGVPVIAIPTTAGTGSEVTIWAVVSKREQERKYGIGSRYLTATLALCDPRLTLSLPAQLTATTGIDALAHALESFVNRITQPISEALAMRAIELIQNSLRTAVYWGDNLAARADMLLASTIAAMAFNPTRLGIAHALAMPLGARHGIPHSAVISILLPAVVDYNLVASLEKMGTVAELLGCKTDGLSAPAGAERGAEAVRRLCDDLPLPGGLEDYGVREEHLQAVAEEALQSGNVPVNPRTPTVEDLMGVLRTCM